MPIAIAPSTLHASDTEAFAARRGDAMIPTITNAHRPAFAPTSAWQFNN